MSYCSECKKYYDESFLFCPIHRTDLIRQTPETELINSIQNRILAAENSLELFSQLTQVMTKVLGAKIFTLYLYDPINSQLTLKAATGIPDNLINTLSYSIEENINKKFVTSWLFETGDKLFSDDIRKIKYDFSKRKFISDLSINKCYHGKYVCDYYKNVNIAYENINPVSFMGAGLMRPETNEKLGVIKAELKMGEDNDQCFEAFSEKDIRIFNAIIPSISLAIHISQRIEEIKVLRDKFENAVNIIMRVFLETLKVKDQFTFSHSKRVAKYASILGESFFQERSLESAMLKAGSLLHDLGKKNIRRDILQKTGPLSHNEMNEIKLHPESGVGIYYEQFKDSYDDLSWLFILLLHHSSKDERRSYPQTLSKGNTWCNTFVKAFGLNPDKDIYSQLESLRGKMYQNYNKNVKHIYNYKDEFELDQKYANLKLMIDIVRVSDCVDAGSQIRPYQFDPKDFQINVTELLRSPKGEFEPRVLDALSDKVEIMREVCNKQEFDVVY